MAGGLAGLPPSAPGTIFGVPIARLRDASLQRKALTVFGIALLVSIVVPVSLSPFIGMWSVGGFPAFIFPIIAGASYLLVAAAPPHIRQQVPPAVLQWLPFSIAFAGIQISGMGIGAFGGGGMAGAMFGGGQFYLYSVGFAVLIFGLLARLANPSDQVARIIIVVGAGALVLPFINSIGPAFKFEGGIFGILYTLLNFLVLAVGVLCISFFFPPQKLPPALQKLGGLAPLFVVILVAWLPLSIILLGLLLGSFLPMTIAILGILRGLLFLLSFFGVLMLTAPAAYDSVMGKLNNPQPPGPPQGGGGYPPPQGGGYPPPQGGGYPPQGGGYPPQGGGYPPQGGGYPPQGGGYPPQGGGGGGGWQ